jgi:hypothetical protein
MGNKVSLNVGCCRRGHLFKLKIDTSDELEDTSMIDSATENSLGMGKSKVDRSAASNGSK